MIAKTLRVTFAALFLGLLGMSGAQAASGTMADRSTTFDALPGIQHLPY